MSLTISRIREFLFNKNSDFFKWNKKSSKTSFDPFLSILFEYLNSNPETSEAYQKLLDAGSSYDNFCRGILRNDGYYPLRDINECIYHDLLNHRNLPDNSHTIQKLQIEYNNLSEHFISDLTDKSRVFTELLTIENCYGSHSLYTHITSLLDNKDYSFVLAWMTVIAIFPEITSVTEKRPDYTQLLKELFADWSHPTEAPSLHEAYETFLKEKLTVDDELEEVIIVHNHGVRALMNQERHTLLQTLIDRAESVKILITEYEKGESFAKHTRNNNVLYLSSYTPPVLMWHDFCKQFPNKVTLHLSPIPAIHQYTEFRFKNPSNTSSFVGFYTYGETAFDRSPFMIIPYKSAYYSNFHTEFEYVWGISHPCTDSITSQNATPGTAVKTSIEFIDNGIEHDAKGIDLAFYAGAEWLMIDTKLSIISKIIERNIPCRILINDEKSVQNVITLMRSADKAYVGLTQNIKQWKEFQKQCHGFIQIKVSHIPLLHAFYHIKSEENSSVRLEYYSYDNAITDKNFAQVFEHESTYYNLYVNEFEYLWERASDIQDAQ